MKTYKLSMTQMVVAVILILAAPVIPSLIIGYSLGHENGYDFCLRQVMQTKNSSYYDRLSPDVKAALSRMEKVTISATSIAGAGDQGESR